jgi:DNA-binding MarR family transcriptional regulator
MDWSALSRFPGPQASPGFALWRDFMRWQRGVNAALRPFGLTQPQFAVLATCGWLTREGGVITQQQLVDFLGLDRMHVSQIASRLEAAGLICRAGSARDQRVKTLSLTATGARLLTAALPVAEAHDAAFFERR